MIRRFSIGAAAVAVSAIAIAIAAPARAQDQGSPWQGWYLGVNIGANWSATDLSTSAKAPTVAGPVVITPADAGLIHSSSSSGNKTGFNGGIEGGYNWRYGDWLLGIETDYEALDNDQSSNNHYTSTGPVINPPGVPITYAVTQRAKTSWMWTLRPRVGYVYGAWLFYGTAGVATSDIKMTVNLTDNRSAGDAISVSDNATKTGWTGGVGAGYALGPHLSVKGEYLWADFGDVQITRTPPSGYVALNADAKVRTNIFRVGLDYRF
jgi:outer membrane immunogenic protein